MKLYNNCGAEITGITVTKIRCPECRKIQRAVIHRGIPFDTCIHHCIKCGYVIMESEWQEVEWKQEFPKGE